MLFLHQVYTPPPPPPAKEHTLQHAWPLPLHHRRLKLKLDSPEPKEISGHLLQVIPKQLDLTRVYGASIWGRCRVYVSNFGLGHGVEKSGLSASSQYV